MNKLLHNKTFRDNLKKWLGLYICTLLVITTVVTYSRYISKMTGKDDARVAKFAISIDDKKICSSLTSDNCIDDIATEFEFKPYDDLDYYFTVNTNDLEVKTYVVLDIKADSHFDVESITDVTGNDSKSSLDIVNTNATFDDGKTSLSYDSTNNFYSLTTDVGPGTDLLTSKTYKVRLKLKDDFYNDNSRTYKQNEAVYVGFSATQEN